jgi:PadR family transcriptional regulator, regulatory protein PadR
MAPPDRKLITREILLGFWKVHILHHAAEQPVVGQWMLAELRRHGYDISPGTLYPLLKRMERNGWLTCAVEAGGGPRARRYYHLTREGQRVLDVVARMLRELYEEVVTDQTSGRPKHATGRSPTAAGSRRRRHRRAPRT